MKPFLLGFLLASLLWAGHSAAQNYWGSDSNGNSFNLYEIPGTGAYGFSDSTGRNGTIVPVPMPDYGAQRNPC